MALQRPRGTRDFLPDEMRARRFAESRLREAASSYGYEEVQTPTFESLELFVKKSGPGVIGEIYNFKDKGERDMALRPELTAPVVRMVFENMQAAPRPLRLFYFGNCFRYDRPQKGRYREFFQFGVELLGAQGMLTDVEVVDLACACLDAMGVEGYTLRVGSIGIVRALLSTWGISGEGQTAVLQALDKLEGGELTAELGKYLDDPKAEMLESLVSFGGDADALRASLSACPDAVAALDALRATCEALGTLGRSPTLDPAVVRGLDYYTGMVFEVEVESLGAEKQVCGGGAYSLGEIIGDQPLAGCGFAIGFDRALLVARPTEAENATTAIVIPMGDAAARGAPRIAMTLRLAGLRTILSVEGRSVSKALKYADSAGADYAVIVGDDELAKGEVTLKDLRSGEQMRTKAENVAKVALSERRKLREA